MISVTAIAMIVLCPIFVVAARLPLLVAEILDRLVVEQAVDRARVRLAVELVHLPPEMRAPLGDGDGECDVDAECARGDRDEAPIVFDDQDRGHECDLDKRRQDRKQRIADERRDAALAALDVAREAAGLPCEMEAHRQRVEMPKDLQPDLAHGALRHLREQELAQLGEERRRQAQEPVGHEQSKRNGEHGGARIEAVDDALHQQRHAHVGELRRDEAGKRCEYPPLVFPQVRQQRAQRVPVALLGARNVEIGGQGRGRTSSHQVSLANTRSCAANSEDSARERAASAEARRRAQASRITLRGSGVPLRRNRRATSKPAPIVIP
jgi:hypothetical protein